MHPVGSIYMSLDSTDPSSLFGGTWEQIQGRFLLATNDEHGVGSIGGEATHKLTVAEMPSHRHSDVMNWRATGGNVRVEVNGSGYNVLNGGTTGNTGSSVAHNNMPPYLAVYMWQRVA